MFPEYRRLIKRRSGEAKAFLPIKFPGIVGVDVAGTVISFGDKVTGFSSGDHVFGMADQTYAELCVVKASNLMKIPGKIDTVDAAALPLVTTTGYQLITNGIPVQQGQTVLVTGAFGNVGRSTASEGIAAAAPARCFGDQFPPAVSLATRGKPSPSVCA